MSFAQTLRSARLTAGLKQKDLAGTAFSATYISHLERGKRKPTPEVVTYLEQRLGLDAGTLAVSVEATTVPAQLHNDRLLAMYEEGKALYRAGNHDEALEILARLVDSAYTRGKADLRWMAERKRIDALHDLGRFDEAARCAEALRVIARRSAEPGLVVRAHIISANMERLRGDAEGALKHARIAIDNAQPKSVSSDLQAQALIAGISATGGDERSLLWQETLEVILPTLTDHVQRANACWVLSAVAYQRGQSEHARELQEKTLALLSPRADMRSWAAFPRAAADFRMKAGDFDGVAELLQAARDRLTILGSRDELAGNDLMEARYLTHLGQLAKARDVLRGADTDELPPLTRGRLRLELARVAEQEGELKQAYNAALIAARLFSQADATSESNEAWEFLEGLGGLPTP